MNKSENILVSIICNTYNHEPYIRQCLEGFVMQKTDFAFEVLIHDDASTDKTAEIIREYEAQYPDIIKPIYQTENQYSKKTGIMKTFQIPRVKGKYIALCEGDDYWIDPLKLQKQVDILEKDATITFVYSNFENVDEKGSLIDRPIYNGYVKKSYSGDVFPKLIRGNFIMTLTTCFRKEIFISDEFLNAPTLIDYLLFLIASSKGNAIYLEEKTGCYRKHVNGLTSSKPKGVNEATLKAFKFISELYLRNIVRQRGKWDNFAIKTFIMRRALGLFFQGDKNFLSTIIIIQKSILLFVIPAIFEICLYKLYNSLK